MWCPECAALNAHGNKKTAEGTATLITLLTNFARTSGWLAWLGELAWESAPQGCCSAVKVPAFLVKQCQTLPAIHRTNQDKWDSLLQVSFSINLTEIGGRLAVLNSVPVHSYICRESAAFFFSCSGAINWGIDKKQKVLHLLFSNQKTNSERLML